MNNNLLILGAGQFGNIVKEIAEECKKFGKLDFLDDKNPRAVGKMCDLPSFKDSYTYAVAAVGNTELRLELTEKLERLGFEVPVIISEKSHVSPSAKLGKGTIVEPMSVIQTDSFAGNACIISSGAVLRHNSRIGDGCHIDCNSVIMSSCILPPKTKTACGEICK